MITLDSVIIVFSSSILSSNIAFWLSLLSYLIMFHWVNLKFETNDFASFWLLLILTSIKLIDELFHLGWRRDNSTSDCCNPRNTYDDVTGTYAYVRALRHNFMLSFPLSLSFLSFVPFTFYPLSSILYPLSLNGYQSSD